MSNILPMIEADSVSFDPHRDKQALADVIADAEIGIGGALADEFINPNPVPDDARQAEALQGLDPIIQEQLGLAMRGKVRNWANFETPKGIPIFKMQSQPDPDLTPEQRAAAATAAGVVVSCDADSWDTLSPGYASSPSNGPEYPQKEDGASTRDSTARTPEAA